MISSKTVGWFEFLQSEDPSRGRATWADNRGQPLLWEVDGGRYSPTGLAVPMAKSVGLSCGAVRGPRWWRFHDGASLVARAYELREGGAD